jgi:hypothetical protein
MPNTAQLLVFALEMFAIYPLFLKGRLDVTAPEGSDWALRIKRYDLLQVADVATDASTTQLAVTHHDVTMRGAAAHTRILEHMVPWLWFAPLLRLPGVRHLHRRWFRGRVKVLESVSG